MTEKRFIAIALFVLMPVVSGAQPRSANDRVTSIEHVNDIRRALLERIEVDDADVREAAFGGRELGYFDRDRTGGVYTQSDAWGLYDYAMAITQFTHDQHDLDGDGLPGFVELECNRAGGPTLDPNEMQTTPGVPDGDADCDGDGLSNASEVALGLNPLIPEDPNLDSDHDGISDSEELQNGTRATPVLMLEIEENTPEQVVVSVILDQDDVGLQPVLADIRIEFDDTKLNYVASSLGDSALAAGGKNVFGSLFTPTQTRTTVTSVNLEPIASGQLVSITFERIAAGPTHFSFDLAGTSLSPRAAREDLTFGVGHPDEPLQAGAEQ